MLNHFWECLEEEKDGGKTMNDKSMTTSKMKRIGYVLILLVLARMTGYSQVRSTMNADTNQLLIGDFLHLDFQLRCNKEAIVDYPMWNDTLSSHFDIIKTSKIDTLIQGDKLIYKQKLTVASYDSGEFYIPPVHINYQLPGDSVSHFTESDPIPVLVVSPPIDMSKGFVDIKKPLEAKFSIYEILPYILGGILVLALLVLLILYLRKKMKKKAAIPKPEKPPLPPREMAIKKLEELRLKKLWQQEKEKMYFTELVDILREYIHYQFNIDSFEMTSFEILEALNPLSINTEAMNKLKASLNIADLVKFAKFKPVPMENDLALLNIIDFVNESAFIKAREEEKKTEEKKEMAENPMAEEEKEKKVNEKEATTLKEEKDV
jgi:hypothetical protein